MAALITAGIFLPPVFMAGGAAGLTLGSVAAGSLAGAIASGGMAILGGAKPKDFFKEMAIGAAMGAVSGKLQQGKFEAKSFANTQGKIAEGQIVETSFGSVGGPQFTGPTATNAYNSLAEQYGATLVDSGGGVMKPVFSGGNYVTKVKDSYDVVKTVTGTGLGDAALEAGVGASKFGDMATQAAVNAGVTTGMGVLKDQVAESLAPPPPVALGGSARQYYAGTRNAVANLTRNYISSGTPSGNSTAEIYASLANNLSYGTGSIDYYQNSAVSLTRGIQVPTLTYT